MPLPPRSAKELRENERKERERLQQSPSPRRDPLLEPRVLFWILLLAAFAGGILILVGNRGDEQPSGPSTWDGRSVAIVLPTEEPKPDFPLTFADASRILKEQGLELRLETSIDGYELFVGRGIEVTIMSDGAEALYEIEFLLNRLEMGTAAQTFNELAWSMGLEKQAERARRMVDWELRVGSTGRDVVDGISVQAYKTDWNRVLIVFWK